MPAIKNWTPILRLLLKLHNPLSRSIMLLGTSTMEKGKGVEKVKEVEVAVLTEVVIMIIMGVVDSMIQARGPLDMAMGARTMATMETRVITTKETRISASHHTNRPNLFSRTNSSGNSNKDLANSSTGVEVTVGTVVGATMVGVPGEVATGASVHLMLSMARDTGRPIVPHNLGVTSAMDPM